MQRAAVVLLQSQHVYFLPCTVKAAGLGSLSVLAHKDDDAGAAASAL
jgi:hypothetical protein